MATWKSSKSEVTVHLISWPPYSTFHVLVRYKRSTDQKVARLEGALRDKGWSNSEMTWKGSWLYQVWDKAGSMDNGQWSDEEKPDLLASAMHAFNAAGTEATFLAKTDDGTDWLDHQYGLAPAMYFPQEFCAHGYFPGDFPQRIFEQSADVVLLRPLLLSGFVDTSDLSAFRGYDDNIALLSGYDDNVAFVNWIIPPKTKGTATQGDYDVVWLTLPDLDLRGGSLTEFDECREIGTLNRDAADFFGSDARFILIENGSERVPPDQYRVVETRDGVVIHGFIDQWNDDEAEMAFLDFVDSARQDGIPTEVTLTRISRPALTRFDGLSDPTVMTVMKSVLVDGPKADPST